MEVMNAKLEEFMTAISELKESSTSDAKAISLFGKRPRA
jgi:hypothetical protein